MAWMTCGEEENQPGKRILPEGGLPCRSCRGFPRASETPRAAGLKRRHPSGSSGDLDGEVSWIVSRVRHSSSSGNFASNSASDIPNATAVALLVAPNAIIARTKRWSASRKFETSVLSSAASAFLIAARRSVIAFRFRPDPGLAPPRPIPRDFVISNSLISSRPASASLLTSLRGILPAFDQALHANGLPRLTG